MLLTNVTPVNLIKIIVKIIKAAFSQQQIHDKY